MKTARTIEQANFNHLVMDIAWFGIALAATTRFLSFYAIRLGASPMELGWLASLPALVLVLATGLSVWWRGRFSGSLTAIWWPSIGYRLVFLLPAFAPFFPEAWRIPWIIVALTIPALPQGMNSSIFLVMMREAVPPDRLTPLFTQRTLAMNLTIMLGAVGFGFLLEALPFPLNYQVMFVAAFGFSMLSQWHLGRLRVRDGAVIIQPSKPRRSIRELLQSPYFQSVAFITLVSHVGYFAITALIPLHLERNLGATEGFIALFGVFELSAAAGVALFVNRLVSQWGNRMVIVLSMVVTALSAVILGVAPTLEWTLISAILSGAGWTTASIGVLGFFAERTEADDLDASTAFHQIIFLALFIGPLVGSIIAQAGLDLGLMMMMGGGLRLLAALLSYTGLAVFGTRARVRPLS